MENKDVKCNIVIFIFIGSTLEELFRYHSILKDFNRHHPIILTSLNHDLLDWHRDYRKLIVSCGRGLCVFNTTCNNIIVIL